MTAQPIDTAAIEAAVAEMLDDHMPASPQTLAWLAVKAVLSHINGDAVRLVPQPIGTAPLGDGWILGYLPKRAEQDCVPWVPLTWGDSGWMDDDGYVREPTLWAPLPDPQPKPTGWHPAEGRVRVTEITGEQWTDGKGNPVTVPWRWIIDIERLDGSCDEYRDFDFAVTRSDAEQRGAKWAAKYGLPVRVVPLLPRLTPSGVTKGSA